MSATGTGGLRFGERGGGGGISRAALSSFDSSFSTSSTLRFLDLGMPMHPRRMRPMACAQKDTKVKADG